MLSRPLDSRDLVNPSEDRSASVVALGTASRSEISLQSARDQKVQDSILVSGWGISMSAADEIGMRLRRIEDTVELMRGVLPQEKVASDRLDGLERTLQGLRTDIEAAVCSARADWDLLSAAIRRADVLKKVEETAFDRIAALEQRHAALDSRMKSLLTRSQTWGAVFFVILAAGIIVGAR